MVDTASYTYDPVANEASVHVQMEELGGGQKWRQYVIAAIANIAITCTGYSMGWTSPITPKLSEDNYWLQSPLPRPITTEEEAWMGSLLTVGAIFGPFIGGFVGSRFGRKNGLLSCALPLIIGWILISIAKEIGYIYAGRIFWGIGVGMLFTISPMYCAEIATDDVRGALGSFLQVFITIGFLIVYAVGPFVSYGVVAYLGIALVLLFVGSFIFMPESPIYYLSKNNREAAVQALMKIRGQSHSGVQDELEKMVADVEVTLSKTAKISDIWATKGNIKAMYVSCALVFFQQFCGINAVLFYMDSIFSAAGSDIKPHISTIIIGVVQMGASFVTPFVVDRLGRRFLLLISSCGTTIALGLLGMFFILKDEPIAEKINFVPILSLVLFMITYCVGLGPMPWTVMGELFPIEVKAIAAPIATAFCWILSFLVTRFFKPIALAVGMHIAFWIFGVCCLAAFFFTLFLVPETKGKSFQEIQDMLNGRTQPDKEKS